MSTDEPAIVVTTRESNRDPSRRVVVVATANGLSIHPLPPIADLVIGRAETCDVRVDEDSVSRRHARLVVDSAVTIEDLGSRNGTRVAGQRTAANERVVVPAGAVIEVGDVLVTVVLASDAVIRPTTPSLSPNAPIVHDPKMVRIYALLDLIAPSDISVLVLGETGTGKEVFVKAVHERSARAKRPLLSLNCAALPEALLESELFGHEQGAFTGATTAKAGLFEAADGGTMFLDEIGDMQPLTQAKLLRVLESGEVMRVGARKVRHVDVRIIAATNSALAEKIRTGSFRSDLYYRLSGFSVTLPPLRDRPKDIEVLARYFAARAAQSTGGSASFDPSAIDALLAHGFPGNVRELKSIVERAGLLSRGRTITAETIVFDSVAPVAEPPAAPPSTDQGDERARLVAALAACAGNQVLAAKELGISRATLLRRLDAYGLARPRKGR